MKMTPTFVKTLRDNQVEFVRGVNAFPREWFSTLGNERRTPVDSFETYMGKVTGATNQDFDAYVSVYSKSERASGMTDVMFFDVDGPPGHLESNYRLSNWFARQYGGRLYFSGCYDDQTEILTDEGFKLFKDLTQADRVATLNPKTYQLAYVVPSELISYHYEGDMFHFEGESLDMLVTPDHNMVVFNPRTKKVEFKKPAEIAPPSRAGRYRDHFLRGCRWRGRKTETFLLPPVNWMVRGPRGTTKTGKRVRGAQIPMEVWLKFLGIYLAEGSALLVYDPKTGNTHYRVEISQAEHKDDVEGIIRSLQKWVRFRFFYSGHKFTIASNKQLWTYLHPLGDKYTKYIPKEFKRLEPRLLRVLLDAMILGDGHLEPTRAKYSTSSPKLANDVYEVMLKCGCAVHMYSRLVKEGEICGNHFNSTHPNYSVTGSFPKEKVETGAPIWTASTTKLPRKQHYNGTVYCATVPHHTLFVKRGNKGVWSGNSKGFHTFLGFSRQVKLKDIDREIMKTAVRSLGFQMTDEKQKYYLDPHCLLDIARVSRIPFTLNLKASRYAIPVDPMWTLEQAQYFSLHPQEIAYVPHLDRSKGDQFLELLAHTTLLETEVPKPRKPYTGTAYQWVERLLANPVSDGRHRLLWLVIAPYLVNVKGYTREEAIVTAKDYLRRCEELKPSDASGQVAYFVDHAIQTKLMPISFNKLKEKYPSLYELIKD